jgi:cobalamin biosynthetic protein CobC
MGDEHAHHWQESLACHGVWVRRFDVIPGVRFGLPADEAGWSRLEAALKAVKVKEKDRPDGKR